MQFQVTHKGQAEVLNQKNLGKSAFTAISVSSKFTVKKIAISLIIHEASLGFGTGQFQKLEV